ncbi:MAG: DnaJ domain-containing protein [Acidobacteriota bacterium]|nr:DnaJ domain-containing protein [Acidobacteriota bacterium]
MNHYEELGVSPSATTAEIRQAYKSLVRVLHPDQQQDENLRRLSELQLRRLNHLFQILSDPEQRRMYDLSLHEFLPAQRQHGPPLQVMRHEVSLSNISGVRLRLKIKPGVAVWMLIGTIALGSGVVWMRAPEPQEPSREIAREQIRSTASPNTGSAQAPPPLNFPEQPAQVAGPAAPSEDPNSRGSHETRRRDRADHASREPKAVEARQAIVLRPTPNENRPVVAPLPTAAKPTGSDLIASRPVSVPEATRNSDAPAPPVSVKAQPASVSGNWLYVPKPDDGKKNLYPPEYIELRINNRAGILRGQYHGKYRVSDRAISSEINFRFEGKQGENVSVLPWSGNNGAKGELRIKRLSDESMEVHWITTTFGQSNTLASGTAVLYRSDPP